MSVNIDTRVVAPGDNRYVEEAWQLKERIRQRDDVLKQRRGFFTDAYRRSTVYCYVTDGEGGEQLIGFAAVRRDGYILFLAVDSAFRGEGFGRRLVARVADNHRSVTCHARTTNENALRFYRHLGFEVDRRIDNYYEDGGDAYYLRLGEEESIAKRLSDFMRG
ncbi:GNAT family N-acetyltransferase [Haladaptatus salinisoli]|uniref:GNAT family N-acetyltransferase n=1 Tax=Haladaptatus salinisoli TaxID=2884876 RepID=UPI001D0A977D|nr:N-acetyltransferase [Haladaptatus salinisoli]